MPALQLTEDLLARAVEAAPGVLFWPHLIAYAVGVSPGLMKSWIKAGEAARTLEADGVQPGEQDRLCLRLVQALDEGRAALREQLIGHIREAARARPGAARWLSRRGLG